MFRRVSAGLPLEPDMQAELQEILREVSENPHSSPERGHGTAAEHADSHSTAEHREPASTFSMRDYYTSDDEPFNERNRELVRQCTREMVLEKLRGLSVNELFLHGPEGTTMSTTRPEEKHISILTTANLAELKLRRDVIIVIGEHTQDLGIWSWRVVLDNDGLEAGSAVGLLRTTGRYHMTGEHVSVSSLTAGDIDTPDSDPPGIIILNPGQLLYSHDLHKNLSIRTWLARPKEHALAEQFAIDDTHNRVSNHNTTAAHLATVFDHILPQLLDATASLYVVGVADGADDFATYMNARIQGAASPGLTGRVRGFAAVQSNMSITDMDSASARAWLRRTTRCWAVSALAIGSLLDMPCDEGDGVESGVLAPTFSAGVGGAPEAAWPGAMHEVLAFFRGRAAEED